MARESERIPAEGTSSQLKGIPSQLKDTPSPLTFSGMRTLARRKIAILRYKTFGRVNELLKEIDEIAAECSVADWNGYGAPALEEKSIAHAKWFVKLLAQEGYLLPDEALAEPSGYLVLNWEKGEYDIALSINSDDVFEWGGLGPDGDLCDTAKFVSDKEIPEEVISLLNTIQA